MTRSDNWGWGVGDESKPFILEPMRRAYSIGVARLIGHMTSEVTDKHLYAPRLTSLSFLSAIQLSSNRPLVWKYPIAI